MSKNKLDWAYKFLYKFISCLYVLIAFYIMLNIISYPFIAHFSHLWLVFYRWWFRVMKSISATSSPIQQIPNTPLQTMMAYKLWSSRSSLTKQHVQVDPIYLDFPIKPDQPEHRYDSVVDDVDGPCRVRDGRGNRSVNVLQILQQIYHHGAFLAAVAGFLQTISWSAEHISQHLSPTRQIRCKLSPTLTTAPSSSSRRRLSQGSL